MALSINGCLQIRNGVYYFRRSVPKELRSTLNQSEIVLSLRTRLRQEAFCRSIACLEITNRLFQELKMDDDNPINSDFKARVREALKGVELISTAENESLIYSSNSRILKTEQLKEIILGLDEYLSRESSFSIQTDGLFAEITDFITESYPELKNIGNSSPEASKAFLQRETVRHLRNILNNLLQIRTNPEYQTPPTENKKNTKNIFVSTAMAPALIDNGPTILDAWNEYFQENKGVWNTATAKQYNARVLAFASNDFVGNKVISKIERKDIIKYRDTLHCLPSHWNKKKEYRDIPVSQLSKMNLPEPQRMRQTTINDHLIILKSFFKWCRLAKGYAIDDDQVMYKVYYENAKSVERAAFTDEEISTIFNIEKFQTPIIDKPYKFWIPLIGAFTGARISEIAQLKTTDIVTINKINTFRITEVDEESEGKEVKTSAGIRLIPIHQCLLELGLSEYAKHLEKKGEAESPQLH